MQRNCGRAREAGAHQISYLISFAGSVSVITCQMDARVAHVTSSQVRCVTPLPPGCFFVECVDTREGV